MIEKIEEEIKRPEILAPAGDIDSLKVAVFNGANAVYFGLKNYNARSKATNFSLDNLSEIVDFCHLYGVRVYITVNTLIKDEEMEDAVEMVRQAYSKHADAFIVQDLGFAKVLKEQIPDVELHASTQMGIHNLEGALLAEEMGFKRIVLSREVTLNDINLIKAWTNLQLEYFVQGALCVAFSGNCYFSALKFKQSGNRGACIQPCRLKYKSNLNNNQGYLLSPRDLCLLSKLKQLASVGIDSLKIEGRMRRPAYVAQAVQSFKNALDSNFNEEVCEYEKNNLKRVFNRGEYNEGVYLEDIKESNIINAEFQNHRGVSIGQVERVNRFKDIFSILIESKTPINNGDALKFVALNGNETSVGVGGVEQVGNNLYVVYSKHSPHKGDIVYKTVDAIRENILCSYVKKMPIIAHFEGSPDCPAKLTLTCGEISETVESMFVCDLAQNQALTYERLMQNIDRFNDTPFILNNLTMKAENIFLPQSRINELRRQAVDALQRKMLDNFEKPTKKIVKNTIKTPVIEEKNQNNFMIIDEICDIESVPSDANLIFAPKNYELKTISEFLIKANELGHSFIYINLPNVANSFDIQKLKNLLTEIGSQNVGVVANNLYGMCFAKLGYKTLVGYQMNVVNSHTMKILLDLGAEAVTKSIESDLVQGLNVGHNYVGKPTMMTFLHCPYKTVYNYNSCKDCEFSDNLTLTAEDNKTYKIRRIRCVSCYFELVFNENIGTKKIPYILDIRDN